MQVSLLSVFSGETCGAASSWPRIVPYVLTTEQKDLDNEGRVMCRYRYCRSFREKCAML